MKKIITLLYFQLCVDVLGFPIYHKTTKITFESKKNNNLDRYYFNRKNNILFETTLINSYGKTIN